MMETIGGRRRSRQRSGHHGRSAVCAGIGLTNLWAASLLIAIGFSACSSHGTTNPAASNSLNFTLRVSPNPLTVTAGTMAPAQLSVDRIAGAPAAAIPFTLVSTPNGICMPTNLLLTVSFSTQPIVCGSTTPGTFVVAIHATDTTLAGAPDVSINLSVVVN